MIKTNSAAWMAITDNNAGQGQTRPAGPSAESVVKGVEELNGMASELLERVGKVSLRLIGTGDVPQPGKADEAPADGLFGLIEQRTGHTRNKVARALEILARLEERL